jgi:hypothetical protein
VHTRTDVKVGPLVGLAAIVLYGLLMLATAYREHDDEGVIVDATCRSRMERSTLLGRLARAGVPRLVVRCRAPLEVAPGEVLELDARLALEAQASRVTGAIDRLLWARADGDYRASTTTLPTARLASM